MTIKPEKPPLKPLYKSPSVWIVVAFLLTISYPLFWGWMQYHGMCISETRWLSDREKIDRVLKQAKVLYREDDPTTPIVARQQIPLSVKSIDQFYKDNVGCCWLGKSPKIDYYPEMTGLGQASAGSRFYDGFQGEVVYLSQKTKDPLTQNDIKSIGYFAINNCGKRMDIKYLYFSFDYSPVDGRGMFGLMVLVYVMSPIILIVIYAFMSVFIQLGRRVIRYIKRKKS